MSGRKGPPFLIAHYSDYVYAIGTRTYGAGVWTDIYTAAVPVP